MTTELSGAEILIETLTELGVEVVFGYPGGAVLPIYDALFRQKRIRHILVRQEGGAAHAAEGYARSTGKPGVVLVDVRPGRDQRRHRYRRCADGFDPDDRHHRPGADRADRHGRVPGMRHDRHYSPLHQA